MRLLATCTLLAAGINAVPTSVQDDRIAVPSSTNDVDPNDDDEMAVTARGGGCATLLESVCRDHRSNVFHCSECADDHIVELQAAGCSNDAISHWCAERPEAPSRCFIEPAWTRDQIVQQKAVPFGQSFNNQTGKMQTLLLDTYEPPASDTRKQRPAFVLIHGGAFIWGNRTSDGEPEVAYALATRGYFVVSIEYRLTGYYWGADAQCYWGSSWEAPCPGTDQTATDAMEDGKAAIRFLRAKASEWRIDPARIGVAGDSAGAITSNWIGNPCDCVCLCLCLWLCLTLSLLYHHHDTSPGPLLVCLHSLMIPPIECCGLFLYRVRPRG